MRKISSLRLILALAAGLAAPAAQADLYSAQAAYAKQDLPRAFELYRELAEMGDVRGQENLAVMYVSGEGVKRDNVLGYAWASIARENGGGEMAKAIVAQLEPHVTPGAREKANVVAAQFGKEAIARRLLPAPFVPQPKVEGCAFRNPANPDAFYPLEARDRGFSGNIMVQFTIGADGRAHNPQVWFATPKDLFDGAARAVVLSSTFVPKQENGVAVPCTMRIKIKFVIRDAGAGDAEIKKSFDEIRPKALAGDPVSQAVYGILLATRSDLNKENEPFLPWVTRAAQAGVPAAQFMLGVSIFNGFTAEQDEAKGLIWLDKAAAGGNADAQATLASYLLRPGAATGDAATAHEWLEKSAAAGNRDGTYALAAMLAAIPDATLRDPKRALVIVEPLKPELDALPTALEIRAAAQAALGNFFAAQSDERKALRKAKALGWDSAPMQKRLDDYIAKKTWTGDLSAL
jgi:TonB family protein